MPGRRHRVFTWHEPSPASLAGIVARQQELPFSYREVGATGGELPAGYRHDRWVTDLGPYRLHKFERAAAALRSWAIQRDAGLTVCPGETVAADSTFVIVIKLPLGYATAAGRVVYLIDAPGQSGFAYGTLPGHPEQGEEAFKVARRGDHMIFEITAFSRPRHPIARIGAPVTRMMQKRVTRRYLAAMRAVVDNSG